MASIAKLVVSLGANVAGFETDMKRATANQKKRMRELEKSASDAGKAMGAAFAAFGVALGLAAKKAADFQSAMAEVSTLLDDTSSVDRLSDSVKSLSIEFGQAPTTQAKALYQIISAGASDATSQIEQLTAANKLAVGGVTDVATAADGLTTVLNAYAGTGLDVNRISDIMFATMKGGKTTIEELASSVGAVSTIAAQVGVSFEEVGASVATLTKSGIGTSEAMNSLQSVLSAVLKQSTKTQAAAKEIGIQFDVTALKSKGLAGVLQDIANSGATEDQLSRLVGRVEGLTNVLASVKNNGEEFTKQLDNITHSAGETDKAVGKIAETTKFQAQQAKAAFEVLQIEIAENLLSSLSGLAKWFIDNIDVVRKYARAIGEDLADAAKTAAKAAKFLADNLWLVDAAIGAILARKFLVPLITAAGAASGGWAVALAAIGAAAYGAAGPLKEMLNVSGPLEQSVNGLVTAVQNLSAAWIQNASVSQLEAKRAEIRQKWIDAEIEKTKALGELNSKRSLGQASIAERATKGYQDAIAEAKALREQIDRANKTQAEAETSLKSLNRELAIAASGYAELAKKSDASFEVLKSYVRELDSGAYKNAPKTAKQLASDFKKLQDANDKAWEVLKGYVDELEAADKAQKELQSSAQGIIDTLYPGEAATRNFVAQLQTLRDAAKDNADLAAILADAEVRLAIRFGQTTQEIYGQKEAVTKFSAAVDEAARIMERAFQSVWENILDGSKGAFKGILDGFKSLLAQLIHQATTQKIVLNIQQGLAGKGTGPNGGIDFKSLGEDLANTIAISAGSFFADSTWGQWGAILGGLAGKAIVSALEGTWLSLGSVGGPIGIAIASILGAVAGDWLSGLFDKKLSFALGGENRRTLSDNQQITTPLGTILSPFGKGGFGSLNQADTLGGQLAAALQEFDTQLADILRATVDDKQFQKITDSLKNWYGTWGEGVQAVDVLSSRFGVILSNFTSDIQDFVKGTDDFQKQLERFGVALSAEKLLKDNQDLFNTDRTTADILKVVEAFQTGGKTITEAFDSFVAAANQVISAQKTLQAFAASNPVDDFNASINELSKSAALKNLSTALFDAIANFDGSIEQLQAIGNLSTLIRQGELELLGEIDGIQKGIAAQLKSLRDFVTGAGAEPASIAKVLTSAEGLIKQAKFAQTPGELSDLSSQFDSLIRSLSEDQIKLAQSDITNLIDTFEAAANTRLATQRQNALDSAASTRTLIDQFLTDLGDPLDIISGALDGGNLPQTLNDGFDQVTQSNYDAANTISQAIQAAFGEGINVQVVISDSGLVTQ